MFHAPSSMPMIAVHDRMSTDGAGLPRCASHPTTDLARLCIRRRKVDREPDRWRCFVRPFNTVAAMRRDQHRISRFEPAWLRFTRELQCCCAREQQDPFRERLIVPEVWRACLPVRNDPLDPDARRGNEDGGLFRLPALRNFEKIIHGLIHRRFRLSFCGS